MRNTIAENMIEILKANNITTIWYGDIKIIEDCAIKSNAKKGHPRKTIQCILNALDKSELFEKSFIISDHSGKKRKYRCFKMKDQSSCSS